MTKFEDLKIGTRFERIKDGAQGTITKKYLSSIDFEMDNGDKGYYLKNVIETEIKISNIQLSIDDIKIGDTVECNKEYFHYILKKGKIKERCDQSNDCLITIDDSTRRKSHWPLSSFNNGSLKITPSINKEKTTIETRKSLTFEDLKVGCKVRVKLNKEAKVFYETVHNKIGTVDAINAFNAIIIFDDKRIFSKNTLGKEWEFEIPSAEEIDNERSIGDPPVQILLESKSIEKKIPSSIVPVIVIGLLSGLFAKSMDSFSHNEKDNEKDNEKRMPHIKN